VRVADGSGTGHSVYEGDGLSRAKTQSRSGKSGDVWAGYKNRAHALGPLVRRKNDGKTNQSWISRKGRGSKRQLGGGGRGQVSRREVYHLAPLEKPFWVWRVRSKQ